jgi:hypothetical protein
MLTIFSTCKPFHGHFAIIQRNAITSWTLLRPRPEIILFGDEEGVAEICAELGLRHVPEIARNEFGTPLLNDLFEKAQQLATHDLLCYVNADIILMSDFAAAVERIRRWQGKFLMIGGCLEADIRHPLDFGRQDWEDHVRAIAQNSGRSKPGPDYFVFPKGLYLGIPPFAIGRFSWEGWLTWKAASIGATIIDATPGVCAVHQIHDYSHTGRGDEWIWQGEETKRNMELSGGWAFQYSVNSAHYKLTSDGLEKAIEWRYIAGRLEPWRRRLIDWTRPLRHALGLRQETVKALLQKLVR